jgi:hypothetical protein
MSKESDELRKQLRAFSKTEVLFPAIVLSVDENEDCCDVEADGEYTDVKLRSVIETAGNRVVIYPKLGSVVLCGRISNTDTIYVMKVSEIAKIHIKIGNTDVVLKGDEIVFNQGSNTTAKADILKTQLNKMSARIDGIMDALNNSAADSASGTFKSSLTPLLASIVDKENFDDIENPKIKH